MSDQYPKTFADYPQSVSHIVSERDGDASKWTPRDALIATLRKLDRGEISPDLLVVTWRQKGSDGMSSTEWLVSSPERLLTLGHLQRTIWALSE